METDYMEVVKANLEAIVTPEERAQVLDFRFRNVWWRKLWLFDRRGR